MYFDKGVTREDAERLKSGVEKASAMMEQMQILKASMGIAAAFKAVYGTELVIDETDDNV